MNTYSFIISRLHLGAACAFVCTALACAQTTYLGGNFDNGANWSSGLPSSTSIPATINGGAYAQATSALNANFGGGMTFEHTAGDVNYDGWQFNPFGNTNVYNLSGGSLTVGRWIVNAMTYNVSGGTLIGTNAATGTHSFANNGHLNLSGSGTVNLDELNYNNGGHQGYIDIAAGWTGSFTIENIATGTTIEGAWETTDWEALFQTGASGLGGLGLITATYDGAPINPADFYTIFQVTNGGTTLSLATGEANAPTLVVAAVGSDLQFTWDSAAGKAYDIVSATDLTTTPDTWSVWQADIPATPPANSEVYPRPLADAKRFFALVAKDAP